MPVLSLLVFLFTAPAPLTAAPGSEAAPGAGVAYGSRAGVSTPKQGGLPSTAAEEELAGEMVLIPGGVFRMGDLSGEGAGNERPAHKVTTPSFWLGKYEVTAAQWRVCAADKDGGNPPLRGGKRGRRPITGVSWDDVQDFIRWLNARTGGGYRLPTEAEWEYAARAGTTTEYSWGDAIGRNRANCLGCDAYWKNDPENRNATGRCAEHRSGCLAPVGSFPANKWGLHDMHGNAWEWVQDCWNDNYAGAPNDGGAWNSGDCNRRAIRGGSWVYTRAWYLRSAVRYRYSRSVRDAALGFRLARDL